MKQSASSTGQKENNPDPDKYFDELRKENYDGTFQPVEIWLRKSSSILSNKNSERKFINMKNYFNSHKFRLAYTFLILAFVVAACNYPVTQQETVSDVMTWSVNKDNTEAVSKIHSFDWIKNGEYTENINGEGKISYSLVIPKENVDRVSDYKSQLEAISGINDVKMIPINETIKRPVYSALLNGIFKTDINATNMSDEELKEEVSRQLKNAGIENAQVDFEKNADGKRLIRLDISGEQLKKEGDFDITIRDGNNVSRMKELRKESPDGGEKFKGKTDSEIRDIVRKDVDPALTDDQIEIIRDGENAMVRIKKINKDNKGNTIIEDDIKLK
ncbi:MAG: hypothetical protein ABI462_08275 [Ignavibacteria bacterium]